MRLNGLDEPLKLALEFLQIVFSGRDLHRLEPLLAEDFSFKGPFLESNSARQYIDALVADPPAGFDYELIRSFQSGSSVCLVTWFVKPGVRTRMAQLFEISEGKIAEVVLIFDTGAFAR